MSYHKVGSRPGCRREEEGREPLHPFIHTTPLSPAPRIRDRRESVGGAGKQLFAMDARSDRSSTPTAALLEPGGSRSGSTSAAVAGILGKLSAPEVLAELDVAETQAAWLVVEALEEMMRSSVERGADQRRLAATWKSTLGRLRVTLRTRT